MYLLFLCFCIFCKTSYWVRNTKCLRLQSYPVSLINITDSFGIIVLKYISGPSSIVIYYHYILTPNYDLHFDTYGYKL